MGNAVCLGDKANRLSNICVGRGLPGFIPPNTDTASYLFNYTKKSDINFANGEGGITSSQGFALDPPKANERRTAKWYTVYECTRSPTHLRLLVSGRAYFHCLDKTLPSVTASGCAFRICARGCPIYESLRTASFTHTAQVATSGVFFSLAIVAGTDQGGLFLCPRLAIVMESGEEVVLVDDRLGPLQPQSFYVDFAILDDGGRNVQIDLIFRGEPMEAGVHKDFAGPPMRTLRTCLQDYTAFNSHRQTASISLGTTDLERVLPATTVHLQHLVVSEEIIDEDCVPQAQPYYTRVKNHENGHSEGQDTLQGVVAPSMKLLHEGVDALSAAASATLGSLAPSEHPQLAARNKVFTPAEPNDDNFWNHICYEDVSIRTKANDNDQAGMGLRLKGEFWVSREPVDKRYLYLNCSSTLAQALTMCVMFRFSCPQDYLQLIEQAAAQDSPTNEKREAAVVLREWHIPANGVVMGIEHDPRNRQLLRMFIEHRNEIKDDMVICECGDLNHMRDSIVHQEIYDAGTAIVYRITLLHSDGGRQSTVLQWNTDELEETNLDILRSANNFRFIEEPSPRFPISPCPLTQTNLSPDIRVFIYSAEMFQDPGMAMARHTGSAPLAPGTLPPQATKAENGGSGSCGLAQDSAPAEDPYANAPMYSPEAVSAAGPGDCYQSDGGTAEDWQSAGGGYSEGELDTGPGPTSRDQLLRTRAGANADEPSVEWRRPVIQSVVLLSKMQEPPFKCFPASLSP